MTNEHSYDTIIIGGGAAGMVAGISAARNRQTVLICEKMPRMGKKLLATGAGRCNLSNETLDSSYYNPEARSLVDSVFHRFGSHEILNFFKALGLAVYSEEGRLFPFTNQASSVLRLLELELKRLGVCAELNCQIHQTENVSNGFKLAAKNGKIFRGRRLILTGGGKSYPAYGSDGNAYGLAEHFGHCAIEPVPSTVPLVVHDPWCHLLQGQRVKGSAASIINGKCAQTVSGEILFTKYGLSGTAILDVSEEISIALNREKLRGVCLSIDLVPFLNQAELESELTTRLDKQLPAENFLTGLLPDKFSLALSETIKQNNVPLLAKLLKNKMFEVSQTRGWNEAEFTAGGIDTKDIDPQTLESKLQPGLYLAGEILNVTGARGGYNLAWAWASGHVAGRGKITK